MIAIKQVLVPTDFSEPSQVALNYGKAFAETFNARLHLVHVLDENALGLSLGDAGRRDFGARHRPG